MCQTILLNDLLGIQNIKNTKVRFNMQANGCWNPIELFMQNTPSSMKILTDAHYYNKSKRNYQVGQTTVGFIPIDNSRKRWLLFHIGEVTKDLKRVPGVGYDYKDVASLQKYVGRLLIYFDNKSQNTVRRAQSVFPLCQVEQILSDISDLEIFPGYENVLLNWADLKRVINLPQWKSALMHRKAVYLITDKTNGKKYVGSAYGKDMLYGRWNEYVKTCDGGNKLLKPLGNNYIQQNFQYSILETFTPNADTINIIQRENFWKDILCSRHPLGYNDK